jgi:hypothetical protein
MDLLLNTKTEFHYHENDFDITAEWHFYAKFLLVCDGVAGTLQWLLHVLMYNNGIIFK